MPNTKQLFPVSNMLLPIWALVTAGIVFVLLAAGFIYAARLAYKHSEYNKRLFTQTLELIDQRDKLATLLAKSKRINQRS